MENTERNARKVIAGFDTSSFRKSFHEVEGRPASESDVLFWLLEEQAKTKEDYIRLKDEYIKNEGLYKDYEPFFLLRKTGNKRQDTLKWFECMINPDPSPIIYD